MNCQQNIFFIFQFFCGLDEDCTYYISSFDNICDMYSQRPYVDCDSIIGPKEPKYEECPSGIQLTNIFF